MKKFMMGLIVGVAITAAGSAYAEEIQSLVGKTIQGQFPVKVAGVQLTEQAAVLDGTSYLPVRAIGEALNMDVSFNADLGIELKAKGDKSVSDLKEQKEQILRTDKIQELNKQMNELINDQLKLEEIIGQYDNLANPKEKDGTYNEAKNKHADNKIILDDITKQWHAAIKEQNDFAESKKKEILSQP